MFKNRFNNQINPNTNNGVIKEMNTVHCLMICNSQINLRSPKLWQTNKLTFFQIQILQR